MSNFLKSAFGKVFFAFLICNVVFNIDATAQKSKSKSTAKSKRGLKSAAIKKVPVDLKLTPVILIHGIGGSDLDYQPPGSKGLFNDGFPNDVLIDFTILRPGKPQNLQFDASGKPLPKPASISSDIKPKGFYDVPRSRDITDLRDFLEKNGYGRKINLFEFVYDFRFSAVYNAEKLKEFISKIKNGNESLQFDIVAHSMGGMIAKQYLLETENAKNVKNLIFVGTPHLGAPKALKALRYGDDMDIPVIDACKLKRAVHNFPGMFNLLPGKKYFEASGGYFEDGDDIDNDKIRGVLNFEQMLNNLYNGIETRCPLIAGVDASPLRQLSPNLVEEHSVKFHEIQGNWKKPNGVRVFLLAGYGIPTLKKLAENKSALQLTYSTEGDGTVPLWSAETADADKIYYLDLRVFKTNHSEMIGDKTVNDQILNLLQRGEIKNVAGISETRPDRKQFIEIIK